MSSTFLKSFSVRTPLMDMPGVNRKIANPKLNSLIHRPARPANIGAEFLTPAVTMSDQPREGGSIKHSPAGFVALGQTGKTGLDGHRGTPLPGRLRSTPRLVGRHTLWCMIRHGEQ